MRIVDLPDREKKDKGEEAPKSTPRKSSSSTSRTSQTADRDLRTRLITCFARIAEAAEARGDMELAEIVRDDADVMATGLVSLTRPFRVLRAPVVLLLSVVEPVMAFSRIGRLFLERVMIRRADKHAATEPGQPAQ